MERSASTWKLFIAVTLCIVFMGVEVFGGIEANSLAILTDAAHLLSDVAAFSISLFSLWAAGWEATPRQSYGFFRVEILGALLSIQMIWVLADILIYEAIDRLIKGTTEVHGFFMFVVAAFGLVVNIGMALLLGHDQSHGHGHAHGHDHGHLHDDHHDHGGDPEKHPNHDHDHGHDVDPAQSLLKACSETEENPIQKKKRSPCRNIKVQGAYLHVLGDSIKSIGVMIGGAIIWIKPEWKIVDLIYTLVFSVIILGTTIRMLRNILKVLMESTPREIDATMLNDGLCDMEEVVFVHKLHIWVITVGKVLLACHVKIMRDADADVVLDKVVDYIRRGYNITNFDILIERE